MLHKHFTQTTHINVVFYLIPKSTIIHLTVLQIYNNSLISKSIILYLAHLFCHPHTEFSSEFCMQPIYLQKTVYFFCTYADILLKVCTQESLPQKSFPKFWRHTDDSVNKSAYLPKYQPNSVCLQIFAQLSAHRCQIFFHSGKLHRAQKMGKRKILSL